MMTGEMRPYYYKALIGLSVLVIVGTGLWLYKRYEAIKATVFEARRVETAAYIQNHAFTLIKPEDFSDQDIVRQQKIFATFFEAIQSPEIFRIKVYNHESKIIWSDLKETIGQDASANQEAIGALKEGNITLKFKSPKPEQVSERQFWEFTETYVPIRYGRDQIVGVIEVYQAASSAKKKIREEFVKSAIPTLLVAVAVYFGAALILRLLLRNRGDVGSGPNL